MDGGMVPDSEFRCRSNIVSEFKALRAVGITPVSALPCRSRYLQCQQKHNNASKVDLTRPQPPQDVESGSVLQETTKQQQLCWYGAGQCIGAQIHVLQGRQCAKASCNGARELICLQLNLTGVQTHAATRQGKPANEDTHTAKRAVPRLWRQAHLSARIVLIPTGMAPVSPFLFNARRLTDANVQRIVGVEQHPPDVK